MELFENEQKQETAVLVSVDTGEFDIDSSLLELTELAKTAGAEVIGEITQRRDAPDSATYIGKGKLEELTEFYMKEYGDSYDYRIYKIYDINLWS